MPKAGPVEAAPLEIRVILDDEVTRLQMSGEFDHSGLDQAQGGLTEALSGGEREVVVDMRRLTFVDSSAIAFLLAVSRNDSEGRVRFLASESPAVRRVLEITGVDHLFGGDGDGTELTPE